MPSISLKVDRGIEQLLSKFVNALLVMRPSKLVFGVCISDLDGDYYHQMAYELLIKAISVAIAAPVVEELHFVPHIKASVEEHIIPGMMFCETQIGMLFDIADGPGASITIQIKSSHWNQTPAVQLKGQLDALSYSPHLVVIHDAILKRLTERQSLDNLNRKIWEVSEKHSITKSVKSLEFRTIWNHFLAKAMSLRGMYTWLDSLPIHFCISVQNSKDEFPEVVLLFIEGLAAVENNERNWLYSVDELLTVLPPAPDRENIPFVPMPINADPSGANPEGSSFPTDPLAESTPIEPSTPGWQIMMQVRFEEDGSLSVNGLNPQGLRRVILRHARDIPFLEGVNRFMVAGEMDKVDQVYAVSSRAIASHSGSQSKGSFDSGTAWIDETGNLHVSGLPWSPGCTTLFALLSVMQKTLKPMQELSAKCAMLVFKDGSRAHSAFVALESGLFPETETSYFGRKNFNDFIRAPRTPSSFAVRFRRDTKEPFCFLEVLFSENCLILRFSVGLNISTESREQLTLDLMEKFISLLKKYEPQVMVKDLPVSPTVAKIATDGWSSLSQ